MISRKCKAATGLRARHPSIMQICAVLVANAGMKIVASARRSGVPLGRNTEMCDLFIRQLALAQHCRAIVTFMPYPPTICKKEITGCSNA